VTVIGSNFTNNPSVVITYLDYNEPFVIPEIKYVQPQTGYTSTQLDFTMPNLTSSQNITFYVSNVNGVSNSASFTYNG